MSKPPLRPLLPFPSTSAGPPPQIPPKKRKGILGTGGACDFCRKRKTACDGLRPTCGICARRSLTCVYERETDETPNKALRREVEELRRQQMDFKRFLTRLKDASQTEVETIRSRLRACKDPLSVVQSYEDGAIQDQRPSSPLAEWMNIVGFHSAIDVQLTNQQNVLYPAPDKNKQNDLWKALLNRDNLEPEHPALAVKSVEQNRASLHIDESGEPSGIDATQPVFEEDIAGLNLDNLHIKLWTSVPVSNQFAKRGILSFLRTDHVIMGLFDPSDFIDSLSRRKCDGGLCLLVNAVLAYSSAIHFKGNPDVLARCFEFEKEVERLWLAERISASANSIAGLILLISSYMANDNWKAVEPYRKDLFQLARQRKLFDSNEGLTQEEISKLPIEERRALAYLSWGAYNYTTMQANFYLNDPPRYPPSIRFEDFLLQNRPYSPVFQAFCDLWSIVGQTLLVYRYPSEQTPPVAFALSQFNALLLLAKHLPTEMAASEDCPTAILIFHIFFHTLVLDLFRPFVIDRDVQQYVEVFNERTATSPDAICAASLRQLKRLIAMYQFYHEQKTPTSWWHIACLYLTNSIIKDVQDPDRRVYVLLCLRAYQRVRQSMVAGQKILQGLLLMAVNFGVMDASEARAMSAGTEASPLRELRKSKQVAITEPVYKEIDAQAETTTIVLDLDRGVRDPMSSRLDVMAEEFENLELFDQFTNDVI